LRAVIKLGAVRVGKERKLAFHRGGNRRTTRSSTSKDEHTLHEVIVDVILVKNLAGNKLAVTACSH
jgi:hypothetical protein